MTATMHHPTIEDDSDDEPFLPPLRGRPLRFILLGHLMSVGQASVADMVAHVTNTGYDLDGRASKIISDSLRWEIRRNRVTRIARGIYRYRSAPATTARRVRRFADLCNRWMTAVLGGRQPPPTPLDTRSSTALSHFFPNHAPWRYLGWLWST